MRYMVKVERRVGPDVIVSRYGLRRLTWYQATYEVECQVRRPDCLAATVYAVTRRSTPLYRIVVWHDLTTQ